MTSQWARTLICRLATSLLFGLKSIVFPHGTLKYVFEFWVPFKVKEASGSLDIGQLFLPLLSLVFCTLSDHEDIKNAIECQRSSSSVWKNWHIYSTWHEATKNVKSNNGNPRLAILLIRWVALGWISHLFWASYSTHIKVEDWKRESVRPPPVRTF